MSRLISHIGTTDVTDGTPQEGRAVGTSRGRIIVIAVSAAAFLIHVWLSYPGILTWDSKMQYEQALSGVMSDWHPPVMATLWRLLLPVSTGGSALLVLHLAVYWTGFAIIALAMLHAGRPSLAAITLALGFAPSSVLLSTFILKDVGFATALILGFAITFRHRLLGRRMGFFSASVVAIALGYATLVRSNGIFGVAPIGIYAFFPIAANAPWRLAKIALLSSVLTCCAIPLTIVINRHVFEASDAKSMLSVVLFDMAGIAYETRDNSIYPAPRPPLAAIDRCYDSFYWDPINQGSCQHEVGALDGVPNSLKAKAWPVAIIRHPLGYAEHRLQHFNQEMSAFVAVRHLGWQEYPKFRNLPHGRMEAATYRATDWLSTFPPTTPMVALVLALTVLAHAVMQRRAVSHWNDATLYLSLSTVGYTVGFAIVGVASMYRYHEYLLMGAPLGAIIATADASSATRWQTAAKLFLPYAVATIALSLYRMM